MFVLILQVIGFVQQLVDLLPDYEIACEHEHSNCLLIAQKKVRLIVLRSNIIFL